MQRTTLKTQTATVNLKCKIYNETYMLVPGLHKIEVTHTMDFDGSTVRVTFLNAATNTLEAVVNYPVDWADFEVEDLASLQQAKKAAFALVAKVTN